MKFYYENRESLFNVPNGPHGYFKISSFDIIFGFKNPIFNLTKNEEIAWMLCTNNRTQDVSLINENIEYFEGALKKISTLPNVKLVFINVFEGMEMNGFYSKLIELKNKYGVKKHQLVVVTPNFYTGNFQKEITIIAEDFLLNHLSSRYSKIKDRDFFANGEKIELSDTKKYLESKKRKIFLSYNKNATRKPRIYFILWLLKSGIIEQTLYSLLMKEKISDNEKSVYSFEEKFEEIKNLDSYIENFNELEYKILDWNCDFEDEESLKFTDTMYTTSDHYLKTLFSIVTETSFSNESLTLTEKTFKPIGNCHPFIIIGDFNSHQKLKSIGFNPYDDLIDYSFDSIFDDKERLNAVFKEIRRIRDLGPKNILDWYSKNIKKIEENKKWFLEFSNDCLFKKVIERIRMKKILITGSSGLVGTHLVKKCIDLGYYVIGCDIIPPQHQPIDSFNFKFLQLDLTKEENIKNLFIYENPDAVFNCFGIKGSPIRAKNNPVDFLYPSFKINTEIINQCAKNKKWLVFVSSVGVYSPAERFYEHDVWKTLPSESDWFPSWSKRMGEILLEAYQVQEAYNDWTIIRPANIFGEYDDFGGNGTVIASTIKKISEAKDTIECWGDGSPIRDFVYAGDVADAIIKLYEERKNIITNFGSGTETSIKEMIETLVSISGKSIIINWDSSKLNGDLRRLMDTTIQKNNGILPEHTLEEGLRITYNYYNKNHLYNYQTKII